MQLMTETTDSTIELIDVVIHCLRPVYIVTDALCRGFACVSRRME